MISLITINGKATAHMSRRSSLQQLRSVFTCSHVVSRSYGRKFRLITPANEVAEVYDTPVCLSVTRISQKVIDGLESYFVE